MLLYNATMQYDNPGEHAATFAMVRLKASDTCQLSEAVSLANYAKYAIAKQSQTFSLACIGRYSRHGRPPSNKAANEGDQPHWLFVDHNDFISHPNQQLVNCQIVRYRTMFPLEFTNFTSSVHLAFLPLLVDLSLR